MKPISSMLVDAPFDPSSMLIAACTSAEADVRLQKKLTGYENIDSIIAVKRAGCCTPAVEAFIGKDGMRAVASMEAANAAVKFLQESYADYLEVWTEYCKFMNSISSTTRAYADTSRRILDATTRKQTVRVCTELKKTAGKSSVYVFNKNNWMADIRIYASLTKDYMNMINTMCTSNNAEEAVALYKKYGRRDSITITRNEEDVLQTSGTKVISIAKHITADSCECTVETLLSELDSLVVNINEIGGLANENTLAVRHILPAAGNSLLPVPLIRGMIISLYKQMLVIIQAQKQLSVCANTNGRTLSLLVN